MNRIGALLALALMPVAAAAQLITNGSFETPVLGSGGTAYYVNGATDITGWTVIAGGPDVDENVQLVRSGYLSGSGYTLAASQGSQWVDLTGGNEGYGKGLTTTFASAAGQQYLLSFDLGRLYDRTPASVDVLVGSAPVQSFTHGGGGSGLAMAWQGHSLGFVGTGAAMSITFLGSAFAGGSSTLVGLDNVAVTAVPEPAALVLALAGIGIVGLARQRGRERAEGESALRGA